MASGGVVLVVRDDHGGAVSIHEEQGEILVGVDENADTNKGRPYFVGLKADQVAELTLGLARRLDTGSLCELAVKILAEIGNPERQKMVNPGRGKKGGPSAA